MPASEHVWILSFWWAAWSLADRYLLPLAPWSEFAVLGACAVTFAARRVPETWKRVEEGLAAATQSHPGVQKAGSPYKSPMNEVV
jgi:hypothetical protein